MKLFLVTQNKKAFAVVVANSKVEAKRLTKQRSAYFSGVIRCNEIKPPSDKENPRVLLAL